MIKKLLVVALLLCGNLWAEEYNFTPKNQRKPNIDKYDFRIEGYSNASLVYTKADDAYDRFFFNAKYYKYIKSITKEGDEWIIEWEIDKEAR